MISAIFWVKIRQDTSFQAQMTRKRARNIHLFVAIRKNQHYNLKTKKTVLLVKIKMSAKTAPKNKANRITANPYPYPLL